MFFLIRLLLAYWLFHPLEGLTWSRLDQVFRWERWRISPLYWPKLGLLRVQSAWQSWFADRVARKFGAAIANAQVEAPIFILGHYRSGTTHLHELMSLDSRFASPTRFQAYQPSSFLATERWFGWLNDLFMLPRRVQEDEIALMNLTGLSPYMDWCWPDSDVDYSRYSTFRRATNAELTRWQAALRWYLAALTVRYRQPILLKSPPHTGRIRAILAVFPDARFVHIRRNPFDVYVSTVRLLKDIDPVFRLRVRRETDRHQAILQTYREMYAAFFEDLALVPPGQFTEIAYEDLETAPIEQLTRVYADLNLGDFGMVEPVIRDYLKTIEGYQKNRHKPMDAEVRRQISDSWAESFERWGYPSGQVG